MKRSVALALAGAVAGAGRAAWAQTLTPVRIGGGLNDDMTPVLYALHAGAFARAGLDVQIKSSAVGAAVAAAIIGGSLDIAKSSLMSLITGYDHGVQFKLVAGGAMYVPGTPTSQLCVLTTSSVTSMADATGKTIGVVTLRALDQIGIQALIDKAGGNSSTVRFVEMPYTAMLSALERGSADIVSIGVPVLESAVVTGKVRTLGDPFAGIADRVLIAAWFCSQDYAQRNSATLRRFADVVRQTTEYTNSHHAETVPLLAEYAHMDPAVIQRMQRGTNAPSLTEAEVQPAIDAAAHYRYITHQFSAKELMLAANS